MSNKITYVELREKINKLKKKSIITKDADRALRESEARYRELIENIPVGLYRTEPGAKGRFLMGNQAILNMFGYDTMQEFLQTSVVDHYWKPNDREIFSEQLVAKGKVTAELKLKKCDGTPFWGAVTTRVVKDAYGGIKYFEGLITDITKRKRAEAELEDERKKLLLIFDSIDEAIYVADPDTHELLYFNEAFKSRWEANIGDKCYKVMQNLSSPCSFCSNKYIFGENLGKTYIWQWQNKIDNHWYRCIDRAINWPDGRIVRYEMAIDISDLKSAEMSLREREQELTIRNQIANIFLTNPDEKMFEKVLGVILNATKSEYGAFGYIDDNGKLTNYSMTIGMPAECKIFDRNIILSNANGKSCCDKVLIEKKPVYSNEPYLLPEENINLRRVLVAPLVNQQETIGNLLIGNKTTDYEDKDRKIAENIANQISPVLAARLQRDRNEKERKMAEEELRVSEEKYRTVLEANPDPVVIYDVEGKVVYFNPAFTRVFGWTLEERVNKKMDSDVPVENWPETRIMTDKIMAGERFSGIETRRIAKGGRIVHVSISNAPYRDRKGKLLGSVSNLRDISEQKQLQAQLHQAQKMEAIGTLAAGIAHDFNNILGAITGCTELALFDTEKGTIANNYLKEVLNSANRATDLVMQILTFSRKRDIQRIPVQLGPLFKETLKLLRASLPSTIKIHQNIESDSGMVLADPTQMHQVLMNLCTNAAHAMREKGGILKVKLKNVEFDSIETSGHMDLSSGNYVELSVSDTGHGIDPVYLERIYDPYFTTKKPGEGTGLGLAVVHGIVKSCKGFVKLNSKLGEGSTFQVFIPRIDDLNIPKADDISYELPIGNERVLFVDDEEILCKTGKNGLERIGYRVVAKTSSTEALNIFRSKPDEFDLIIADMIMPNMTGLELAKEISGIRPDIPIILCTGFSEIITKKDLKMAGVRELVMKPLMIRKIAEIVRKVLDQDIYN